MWDAPQEGMKFLSLRVPAFEADFEAGASKTLRLLLLVVF
jgi:hypothetical protein